MSHSNRVFLNSDNSAMNEARGDYVFLNPLYCSMSQKLRMKRFPFGDHLLYRRNRVHYGRKEISSIISPLSYRRIEMSSGFPHHIERELSIYFLRMSFLQNYLNCPGSLYFDRKRRKNSLQNYLTVFCLISMIEYCQCNTVSCVLLIFRNCPFFTVFFVLLE
jgi:hypothetical protein